MEDTGIHVDPDFGSFGSYIPECDQSLKPFVGQQFKNLDDAIMFYRIYGGACGFDIRLGSEKKSPDGVITWKYVFCSCEGKKNSLPDKVYNDGNKEKKMKVRRVSRRVDCMARLVLKYVAEYGYMVANFIEAHTHTLVADQFKKYLKANKKMGFVQQNFILDCHRANIPPMKSYRLFKEVVGSYTDVGCTGNDYRNFARDLRAYISGCDAQMMLNTMFMRKESSDAFFFDFSVDKDDNLKSIFWADAISRRNYAIFGDVVSFDCTYKKNRYEMIFAPFTGKDNHGKCVTFGAALLSGENRESFEWVFDKFKECMGGSPRMMITDQDPAMKIAMERVLPHTRHRLCMWHIMLKVPDKCPSHLKNDDAFRKRLNAIVWTDIIEPDEFEKKWKDVMADFDLTDHSWFNSLFEIRQNWIPAYFRDYAMSGLCRTTSISESMNSFFSQYLNLGSNLVEFLMHFDSAMDAQRNTNELQNHYDHSTIPQVKTPKKFEKHAATVYTSNMFIKVQDEIEKACYSCSVIKTKSSDVGMVYEVEDGGDRTFMVSFNKEEVTAACTCKKFIREGILCCHVFHLFNQFKWVHIPDKYIIARWTRTALMNPLSASGDDDANRCAASDERKRRITSMISDFYACVGAVEGDEEKTKTLMGGIHDLKEVLVTNNDQSRKSTLSKSKLFDIFFGTEKPTEIHVNPPLHVTTKGSGSDIKSREAKAARDANKNPRKCGKCRIKGFHDSRNCPGA